MIFHEKEKTYNGSGFELIAMAMYGIVDCSFIICQK